MYANVFPEPVLPESCLERDSSAGVAGTAIERRWVIECDGGLGGKTIAVELLGESRTVAVLRLQVEDGTLLQQVLTPEAPSYIVPIGHAVNSVLGDYIRLGIEHILIGADHLLFVAGLLLLSGSLRTLLKTVTAFTLGHSVTLALVSLEVMPNAHALTELLIAATILILALELSRPPESTRKRYLQSHPWSVAGLFGLVHGLGFANVLRDIGMPSDDLVRALLSFNVGIEIGQLVFVGLLAALLQVVLHQSVSGYRTLRSLIVTAMGGISVFWCLERSAEIVVIVL